MHWSLRLICERNEFICEGDRLVYEGDSFGDLVIDIFPGKSFLFDSFVLPNDFFDPLPGLMHISSHSLHFLHHSDHRSTDILDLLVLTLQLLVVSPEILVFFLPIRGWMSLFR